MNAKKLLRQLVTLFHRPSRVWLLCLLLCIGLGAALVQADGPNQAGLVVVHGDKIITRCIEFTEDKISGYELLERSGLDLNADFSSGMGAAICRLDGQGCTYPQEDCFCQCGDPCVFWSYWHLDGTDWRFSSLGASNYQVSHGQVDGWTWGEGSSAGDGAKPPVRKFEEICAAPPTATNTYTPQPTATPTSTPQLTATPPPTSTPTPIATPVIHSFSANQTTITAGQSVQLSWDLSNAEAAFLRYNGQEEGIVSPGSKIVSPTESTVYTLIARNTGGESSVEVTITVNESPPPTATTATLPSPAPAAVANQAAPPTPAPEPVISFGAAAATLPLGSCTNIKWAVQQADALFLDNNPVALQGTQEACPTQTQTFRLRAVYPGGEKLAELTLTVTDGLSLPTGAPTSAGAAVEAAQAGQPSATAVSAVVSPVAKGGTPVGPRRFTVSPENNEGEATSIWWVGAVIVAMGLFVVVPLALIIAGWVMWWFKGYKQGGAR